jgi:hypothetical protein
LRQAIFEAGLDPDRLAALIEVDSKTVQRWLSGGAPYPRHRVKVAKVLGRQEHELWPEAGAEPISQHDLRRELQAVFATAEDPEAPDWRELLEDATNQIDLLGWTLIEILAAPGAIDQLKGKAASGLKLRILISAPDSAFLRAAAGELGLDEVDYIGRSGLQLEAETARGHLEQLAGQPRVELREFYTDPRYTILRFDEQLLITPHLHSAPLDDSPLLYLRRRHDGGLFDRFAAHLDAIASGASRPVEPMPGLYPDPHTHPDRYEPLTAERYQQELGAAQQQYDQRLEAQRPIEQVRAELRLPDQPAQP